MTISNLGWSGNLTVAGDMKSLLFLGDQTYCGIAEQHLLQSEDYVVAGPRDARLTSPAGNRRASAELGMNASYYDHVENR